MNRSLLETYTPWTGRRLVAVEVHQTTRGAGICVDGCAPSVRQLRPCSRVDVRREAGQWPVVRLGKAQGFARRPQPRPALGLLVRGRADEGGPPGGPTAAKPPLEEVRILGTARGGTARGETKSPVLDHGLADDDQTAAVPRRPRLGWSAYSFSVCNLRRFIAGTDRA
jgi:hypothetical protein